MRRYLFAAQWDDGTYEIIVSNNGEAEHREALAKGLTGPRKISYAPITKRHTEKAVRAHFAERFGIPAEELVIQYIGQGCQKLGGVA